MVGRPFRSNLSMSAMDGQRAQGVQRYEGARERRQRRLRAEARVRYRLCRDAMLLASHRGGPVVGSSTGVQPQVVRGVGGPAGIVASPLGLREVVQSSPLPQVSLVICHAPSLAVPQLVEEVVNVQADVAMFQKLWIGSRVEAWNSFKSDLRVQHVQYKKRLSQARVAGEFVGESGLCPLNVANVHDVDGLGKPLYSNFMFEDWVILLWTVELHLVAHGFLIDSFGPGCPGVPEHHVARVYESMFGRSLDTSRLNCTSLAQALNVLVEPVQLISGPGRSLFLVSRFSPEAHFDEFVRGVESHRCSRMLRVSAGDELARLRFPKPGLRT